jgi:lipopolysaccharide export LptBFGC system permease protein LptF
MWKLHRYYLRELLISAGITFLVLFAVVLVSLVYRGIQKARGGELIDAAMITLLFALDSLQHLLTISFLIAVVMTFTRAAQDRELVAIRAAGISPRTPMTAALLAGILLSVLGSFALHYVIPWVHYRKYRVIADVVQKAFTSLQLGSDRIKVLDTGYLLTFREHRGEEYFGCTVYCPRPLEDQTSPILLVDRVAIPKPRDGALSIELYGITDPTGEVPTNGGGFSFRIPLNELAGRDRRDDRDDDLRSDQLLAEVLRGMHRRPHEAVYTLFRRCCFALMPAVLAPIGYCLAELARDRGRVVALMLALVPLVLFYLGEVLGARLLLSSGSPWSAWLPLGLLAVFGVPLCWRQLRR